MQPVKQALVKAVATVVLGSSNLNKIIPFKNRDKHQSQLVDESVREQAALWLARLDAGASEQDRERIGEWLNQHPDHLNVFMDMARLWDRMAVLEELSTVFPLKEYAAPQKTRQPSAYGFRFAVASVALLAISVVAVVSYFGVDPFANNLQAHYETRVGEQLTVNLNDGSQIILNTATVVDVNFSGAKRKIILHSGEVLFEVAKDASRPFQVVAGKQMVEAVGTAFSVHRTNGVDLEVVVTEGKVRLYRQAPSDTGDDTVKSQTSDVDAVALVAGQYAASSEDQSGIVPIDMAPDQVETKLSWQHGMLLFRDDPLEQVLSQVARYTTMNIEVADEIRQVRVGGYFRVNDVEAVLAAIENNFDINVRRIDNNNIYLVPK